VKKERERERLTLYEQIGSIHEGIELELHWLREWALKWVLAPILYFLTICCMGLVVADACGWIHPMRDELISIIKFVLVGEAITGSIGAGFGWLFNRKSRDAKAKASN
jgi:hypothetical protein